jgi:dTDP-4-dehydrorhamnose reductase
LNTPPPIAILGATGMLGQALCRVAAAQGRRVVGLARRGTDHDVDATDGAALHRTLEAIAPDLVINAAALTNLDACERDPGIAYRVNAGTVATLAEYCTVHGVKLVQVSTDHYFTGDGPALHGEDSPVRLVNAYARSKFAGEAFAGTCPGSLILRTNLVGLRGWAGRPTFAEWAIAALLAGEPMILFEDFFTSSLDVAAFSAALFELVDRDAAGLINLAARDAVSKAVFVGKLARAFDLSTEQCRPGSLGSLPGAPRAESLGLDVGRAEHLLGRRLPDTDAVITSLLQSYRDQCHAVR